MATLKRIAVGALIGMLSLGLGAQSRGPVTQAAGQGAATGPCPGCGGVPAPMGSDFGSHPLASGEKGGMDETGPYELVPDHFKPPFPAGYTWAATTGVWAESPDRIYIYTRGMLPKLESYMKFDGTPAQNATGANDFNSELGKNIRREHILTIYDRQGNLIDEWKELDALHQAGSSAHRIRVSPYDPEKHVWLIDEALPRPGIPTGQILKMTRTGKMVMRIGPDKVKNPQDIAFLPNGDFWCIFGFNNNRVVKFSKDGEILTEFSRGGSAPGEILSPHAITIDKRGRIIIGESGGHRIQVFDQSGKSLDIWPNIRFGAGSLAINKQDILWIGDAVLHKIASFDLDGHYLYGWGTAGLYPGQLYGVSQFSTDSENNLYVVEHYGGRVQMFRPKKGADPKRLVGQIVQ